MKNMAASSQLQEIKDRLDVAEVLSSYIKLNKAGRNFKALCPFHNEKTPSFVVSTDRQIWHCFGCGEGGDIFTFVMKIEGLEFPEAIKMLAERAGVELRNYNFKENLAAINQKTSLYAVCEEAKNFYKEKLNKSSAGAEAKKYLLGRGVTEESIANFEIGYAPDDWHETESYLIGRGFGKESIFAAGFTVKSEKNKSFYDRFRGRIMFPILDISGRTAGFGGRTFAHQDSDEAKYINTPESPIYSKSKVLYGLNFARGEIRKTDACVLVEGYMDVIGSHQMDQKNTISSSGTALTSEQIKIIKRYTSNLILSFDGDEAGQEATSRSIDLAMEAGLNVRIIILPAEKDPSDFVDNPEEWRQYVKKSKRIIDFYFEKSFKKNNIETVEGKKQAAAELLAAIKKIPNSVEQAHWLEILSEKIKIEAKVLAEELKKIKSESKNSGSAAAEAERSRAFLGANNDWEWQLVALLLVLPGKSEKIKKIKERQFIFFGSEALETFEKISGLTEQGIGGSNLFGELKKVLPFETYQKFSEAVLKIEYFESGGGEEESEEENAERQEKIFIELLNRLALKYYEKQKKLLESDIKQAEKNKDYVSRKILLENFNEVLEKIKKITLI